MSWHYAIRVHYTRTRIKTIQHGSAQAVLFYFKLMATYTLLCFILLFSATCKEGQSRVSFFLLPPPPTTSSAVRWMCVEGHGMRSKDSMSSQRPLNASRCPLDATLLLSTGMLSLCKYIFCWRHHFSGPMKKDGCRYQWTSCMHCLLRYVDVS